MHFKTESAADSSGLIRFFGYNKKNRLDFHEKMCIISLSRMGYRLMVGQRILIPSVLVRVQVAQPLTQIILLNFKETFLAFPG